jgi:hypothetical protein
MLSSERITRQQNPKNNKAAKSESLCSPISHATLLEHIQAFVDDSHGLMITDPNNNTPIKDIIKHNMQEWEALLHTVGGKLEISTCQFVKFGPTIRDSPRQCPDPHIKIMEHETKQPLALIEASTNQSYKLLGVNIAFDGNNSKQSQAFLPKCEKLPKHSPTASSPQMTLSRATVPSSSREYHMAWQQPISPRNIYVGPNTSWQQSSYQKWDTTGTCPHLWCTHKTWWLRTD